MFKTLQRISLGMCRVVLGVLLLSGLPAAELLSDYCQAADAALDRCLTICKDSKEDLSARTCFGIICETNVQAITNEMLEVAILFSRRPYSFEKAASLLALSPNRRSWCEGLMKIKAGVELAAATQAASALIAFIETEKNERMPGAAQPVAPKNKKQKAAKNNKVASVDVDLVTKLLQDKAFEVQEYAMLAAAYSPDDAFTAAVTQLSDKSGVIAGLKLLYHVNLGKDISKEMVETAFGKLSKQVKPIRSPNKDMMYQVMILPAIGPACEALGLRGEADFLEHVHKAFSEDDLRVQIEAAKAMGRIADPRSLDLLLEKINERKGKAWPVMIEVLSSIGAIPDKKSVPALIELLDKETGRLRLDILYALSSIRGEKSHFQDAKQWQEWWSLAEKDFVVDVEKTNAFRSSYLPIDMFAKVNGDFYGLPIFSDRICFVVDTSNSMSGLKIDNLREQAVMAIESLISVVQYNLVDFGGKINLFYPSDLCQDKKGIVDYIKAMPLSRGTRSLDSMEVGMELNSADTVYFLSDGAPVQCQMENWSGIHPILDFENRYRPMAMFTVSFSAGKANAKEMAHLARRNNGLSQEIE